MTTLAKPATATFLTSSDLGTSGTPWYIKAVLFDIDHNSRLYDTSGAGDTGPVYENNGWEYTDVVIHGFMVASQAIGLNKLVDTNNNPIADVVTVGLGGGREINFAANSLMVERFRLSVRRDGAYVPIRMTAKVIGNTAMSEASV